MAAPHATGVAALAVSRFGTVSGDRLVLEPKVTEYNIALGADRRSCPRPKEQTYTINSADGTRTVKATCDSDLTNSGFYGRGLVSASTMLVVPKLSGGAPPQQRPGASGRTRTDRSAGRTAPAPSADPSAPPPLPRRRRPTPGPRTCPGNLRLRHRAGLAARPPAPRRHRQHGTAAAGEPAPTEPRRGRQPAPTGVTNPPPGEGNGGTEPEAVDVPDTDGPGEENPPPTVYEARSLSAVGLIVGVGLRPGSAAPASARPASSGSPAGRACRPARRRARRARPLQQRRRGRARRRRWRRAGRRVRRTAPAWCGR